MYTFSVLNLAHHGNFIYIDIGPPLDAVELKKTIKNGIKISIGCSAGNPGSKRASYTKSPEKAEICRISAAANLV